MKIYIIYDNDNNKYISKKNKNGVYYSLADAKRGLKNSATQINKKSKKERSVNGRHLLIDYNDYIIKEFELVEKERHKV